MLDAETQHTFNSLRRKYFPPERNYLDAHLTLFHHLPADKMQIVKDIELTAMQFCTMKLQVAELRSIGNGVAYKIVCDPLLNLHKRLQQQWAQWLISQDRQKLWPHVTIQNKVGPHKAAQLKEELEQNFKPFEAFGTGLSLFEYQGGPWEFLKKFDFLKQD